MLLPVFTYVKDRDVKNEVCFLLFFVCFSSLRSTMYTRGSHEKVLVLGDRRGERSGAVLWRKEDGRGVDVPIGGNSEQVMIIRDLKEANSELQECIQGRLEGENWVEGRWWKGSWMRLVLRRCVGARKSGKGKVRAQPEINLK